MVAGVAYSSFAFKPLWHPPLVRNVSFAIQNAIPMESMKTLKFVFFLFTRQQIMEKNITLRRIIENQWEYQETFKNMSDDRLHSHVTGHLPTKRLVKEYHADENHTDHMLHQFTNHLSALLQPGYEYTDVREYKKQPNKIAKTLKPSGSLRGRRHGVSL